jgi:hypothetical protein
MRIVLRFVAVLIALGVTFFSWFAYAIVAVEGHDSRPVLRMAWWIAAGASLMATLLLAKPPVDSRRLAVAYLSIAVALLGSWGMRQHDGLMWGRLEEVATCVAMTGLASSVAAVVPPAVRAWLGDSPYASRSNGYDA